MSDQRYPLAWPKGRPRTSGREKSRFETGFASARDTLGRELDRLGARNVVLSTNVELRIDGQPYANRAEPADPGVAIYFTYAGKPMCFACDRWDKVKDNIQAICKTIEALRGIARWGTGDMLQAAFTGFAALPAPGADTARGWRTVLGWTEGDRPSLDQVEASYRRLASNLHPDRGGSPERMAEINEARDAARRELLA